jgi:hypothetical protein
MYAMPSACKAQNKWCRIAICYPATSDLQFATQNYTQTNKKCEELLHKIIFLDCVMWTNFTGTMGRERDGAP